MGRAFWILVAGRFVSALGDGFFFPFTALFLSRVHGVPPAEVGLIMAAAGLGSLAGRLPGGALTDRIGFKPVVLAAMIGAGGAVIAAGFAPSKGGFALAYAALSFLVWGSFPAFTHGLASLAPAHRREEAFSIMNLLQNAAIAIGPLVGAWMVARDFRLLFVADGLSFFAFALIVGLFVPGQRASGERVSLPEGLGEAASTAAADAGTSAPMHGGRAGVAGLVREVRRVFWLPPPSEGRFWRVAVGSCLMALFYSQMGSALPIDIELRFGRAEWYSLLWTVNGAMIALLQLPTTRWTHHYPRRVRMAVAALVYAAAGLLFLGAWPVAPYVVAFVVLTAGEMLFMPLVPAELASVAPVGQGGRYQAAGSFVNGAGWALGPLVGGQILGRLGHDALWWTMVGTALLAAWVMRPLPERPFHPIEPSFP
ncbi:MFS transporter [Limnochorda pilosa]|uniref:MFS transporter n=1 Tax=Limnochorda pilosa TaxID=1555112 RepID=A0A0K2SJN2_LIMPI|nr:MFS transporter [Limnochorda pilosa]BAS27321.1 MFS transporter [Limnochorda pilosa]